MEKEAYVADGLHVNSGFLDGLNVADAKKKMIAVARARARRVRSHINCATGCLVGSAIGVSRSRSCMSMVSHSRLTLAICRFFFLM
jgi:hypothetical protein